MSAIAALAVPSVEEIKQRFRVPRGGHLFFSGGLGPRIASRVARSMGLSILEDFWDSPHYTDAWIGGPNESDFWGVASRAFAEKASGTVYVLLPKHSTNFPTSKFWTEVEWPTLMGNKHVKKVMRINPDDAVEEVLYCA